MVSLKSLATGTQGVWLVWLGAIVRSRRISMRVNLALGWTLWGPRKRGKDIGRRNRRRCPIHSTSKLGRPAASGVQQNGRHPTGHAHHLASRATAGAIRLA